jgi:putative hemolysin
LVFGELLPKQIAMRKAESLALGLSGLIYSISKVFKPLVSFLTFSTNSVLKLFKIDPNAVEDEVGEEEIRMMVDAGTEKGTIDDEEREFIQNVFEFDDLTAEELVTHRTDVVLLDLEDSMEVWREILYRTRYTRYPVCDGSSDNVVGILNAKEYFRMDDRSREQVMERAVVPAYFVPDTVKADTLFRNMKKEKKQMAVVIDEYGGMTGIITMNDLVEQLVGDLGNDEDTAEETIRQLEENVWEVCGCISLEEISEMLSVSLLSEEYDTLNGLILDILGTIPREGEVVELTEKQLHIRVVKIENRQVEKAIITLQKEEVNK